MWCETAAGGLMSEVVAPFVVTLRIPNRGRLIVDDGRRVSINVSSLTSTIFLEKLLQKLRSFFFRTQCTRWGMLHLSS